MTTLGRVVAPLILTLALVAGHLARPERVGAQATEGQGTPQAQPAEPGPAAPGATPSPAQGAEPAPKAAPVEPGKTVGVSLREAIALTFANNLDLQVEAITPEIRAAEIGEQQGAFDPTIGAQALYSRDRSPTGSVAAGNDTRIAAGQVTLSQRLPLGTAYELSYNTDRLKNNSLFSALNPSYSAEVLLQVTQPLLRNFGVDVNRAGIIIAQRNREAALATFRGTVQNTLFNTVQTYWALVQAQDALEVARESLRLAQQLLQQNRVQVQVGTMAPIEVTQAEAGVASREEGVIVAEANLRDAEDRLKRQILLDPANAFDYTIVPTDRPEFTPVEIELAPNLEAALRFRPELEAARIAVRAQEANLRLARNQVLPELNLVGSLGLNGLDDDWPGANSDVVSEANKQYQWSAGIVFSYPLGNRVARSRLTSAELALRQAQLQVRTLELQIIEEVRAAVRAVNANAQRVQATREATRLAREQLTAEQRRLAVGLSTSFEVLRLQTDLATAQNAEITAITDYRVSLANLDRVAGVLLNRYGIMVK
ncbi:MAG TPA: TolC family protein [Thermodesulfobacteriota bacterium]